MLCALRDGVLGLAAVEIRVNQRIASKPRGQEHHLLEVVLDRFNWEVLGGSHLLKISPHSERKRVMRLVRRRKRKKETERQKDNRYGQHIHVKHNGNILQGRLLDSIFHE